MRLQRPLPVTLAIACASPMLVACSGGVSCADGDARERLANAFRTELELIVQRDFANMSAAGRAALEPIATEFSGLRETAREGAEVCDGEGIATVRLAPAVSGQMSERLEATYLAEGFDGVKISGDTLRANVTYRIRRSDDAVESVSLRSLADAAVAYTMQLLVSEDTASASAR